MMRNFNQDGSNIRVSPEDRSGSVPLIEEGFLSPDQRA